ncbi:DNA-3-methyladenine glycosylase 2 family protein [Bacillus sp. HNG]|uniref:DNA-3-methyladenine glycosylase family protein n=1 Tax=Bacillus sp. HNG TaxID=2293325 RepID=UPI000E2EEC83|nr:DNA-3-methyladenine glycosylase [Bacillus sp. HNG]RFB13469.1 DNA-3-methyladenine glycosylase 2 family protein [Bacillus sp. HNG]
MWEKTVHVQPPYDFDRVLDRLSINPTNYLNKDERSVKVPFYIKNEPEVVTVKATGTTDEPSFVVTGSYKDSMEYALQHVSHIFQWDVSLQEIQDHFLQTDLRDIFIEHRGTPLVLDFDPYFSLMKCIIHQQLNMTFAHTLTSRFVTTFGQEIEGTWIHPRPEKIAELSVADLRELQFSGRKAEYVIDTSKLIASGELTLSDLRSKSDEGVMETLVKIRGIGKWTAENFLLFALGRPNLFPMADIGIQNAIKKLYNLEKKPTYEQMEEYSKPWEPYLSYASLYLWRSIE